MAAWPVTGAAAATVVAPVDGATVGSRPAFRFDVPQGTWELELAKSPETLGSGYGLGAFIDTRYVDRGTIGGSRNPPFVGGWDVERIDAGRYFWHVRVDAKGAATDPAWSPTRRLVVRDEPARLDAFALRATRLARTTPRCASRVQLSGTAAAADNDPSPRLRLSLRWRPGATVRPALAGGRFGAVVCTRRTVLTVRPVLRDGAGQLTRGPAQRVRVRP